MSESLAVPMDRYQIVVCTGDAEVGDFRFGLFASEQEAESYGMMHRTTLGLDRCVSWHVECIDA